jgi:hypothetical protein
MNCELHNCPLPNRAVKLISEYSKPTTRPNWRNSKPIITTYKLYLCVKNCTNFDILTKINMLHFNILSHICDTEWYYIYIYINFNGLTSYLDNNNGDEYMTNADGIQDAIIFPRLPY